MNLVKTAMLLAGLTALFMGAGFLLGGTAGLLIALVLAAATNFFTYWNSDKLALRMHNAQPATRASNPELHETVARLSARAGLPMPGVYVIDQRQPNAFATGRNPDNAAVAVTLGLLHQLDAEEVEAVIAHELAHIKNHDTLIMTVAATIAGAVSMLANFGMMFRGSLVRNRSNGGGAILGLAGMMLAMFLAPMAAGLVQMCISRTREFAADRGAAEITGKPLALASALSRIVSFAGRVKMASAETHKSTAHMFIINPLVGMRLDRLFSTHPPAELRIAALKEMAAVGRYTAPERTTLRRPTSIPRVLRRRMK